MEEQKFPELYHGRPEWPNSDDKHLFWVGLNTHFQFSHHPQCEDPGSISFFCQPAQVIDQMLGVLEESAGGGSILVTGYRGTGKTSLVNYCLEKWKQNRSKAKEKKKSPAGEILQVRVNMATVASAHDVLLLTYDALDRALGATQATKQNRQRDRIKKLQEDNRADADTVKKKLKLMKWNGKARWWPLRKYGQDQAKFEKRKQLRDSLITKAEANLSLESYEKIKSRLAANAKRLRATRITERHEPRIGIDPFPVRAGVSSSDEAGEQTFEREAISRFQAKLVEVVQEIHKELKLHLVFVFDEVDKLTPVDGWQDDKPDEVPREVKNLASLQQIVAELKYFLSESKSHQIFIAGKDVDDSWAEDQNKGEGIFESIFACNISVSSIFTLELEPCRTPLPKSIAEKNAEDFFATLAGEMGIPQNSLVFRTALLILPHLAEYEIVQLLTRGYNREPALSVEHREKLGMWLKAYHDDDRYASKAPVWKQPGLTAEKSKSPATPWFGLSPMSERTCRRLRILLEYLTYKGRGIPRKILREFYGMVRPVSCVSRDDPGFHKLWTEKIESDDKRSLAKLKPFEAVKFVLAFPQHHLQKMNFYASIVEHLDENFALLRGLNDKGRVSIFHIIDYLLKFYTTGFSHRDLEHAPFMTDREELFPSRQLALLILRIMEGKLWKRKDSRSAEYRMLHHVAHDLGVMFLRYGPEQMELRHTLRDFREEVPPLRLALEGINGVKTDERLAPIHAQLRLARIMELCGRNYDARLGYYRALRWLRLDVSHFEQVGSTVEHTKSQTLVSFRQPLDLLGRAAKPSHTSDFPIAFATYTVETHLALGRLLEEVGELRAALQHYEEACGFCECYPLLKAPPADNDPAKSHIKFAEYAQSLWGTLCEDNSIELTPGRQVKATDIQAILSRRPPMLPLKLHGMPQGYAQACNNAATAYSKLWERTSANAYLLKALFHLDATGDEYGLVDQLFFIGQLMVRRRDLTAAAFWYRAALLKAKAIRDHAREPSKQYPKEPALLQTGAGWQTPPLASITEGQIVAALGDVIYATGGYAFHEPGSASTPPKDTTGTRRAVWDFITKELQWKVLSVDDRWEEYFFTLARRWFEAGDHNLDARDVYLRQLEIRLSRFVQASSELDQKGRTGVESLEYTALNAWTTFWRGARVLLHRNLTAVTSLSRDKKNTWGRVGDFRRMGTTLRLIGSMLAELGLRPRDSHSRRLLFRASQAFQKKGQPGPVAGSELAPVDFYRRFVYAMDGNENPLSLDSRMEEWEKQLPDKLDAEELVKAKNDRWFKSSSRINVNTAAADILTIFTYISDREELLHSHLPAAESGERVGHRSPLFRLNGDSDMDLPLSHLKKELCRGLDASQQAEINTRFRLLVIAEKALLSSYLCYRDCIPDFSYAMTCVQIGELYAAALYKLGTWTLIQPKPLASGRLHSSSHLRRHRHNRKCLRCGKRPLYVSRLSPLYKRSHRGSALRRNPRQSFRQTSSCPYSEIVAIAIDHLTEHAKRFLNKAIDILNREQEQNRNTFHLMSEAWFNLADILVIRLLAVTGSTVSLESGLLSVEFESATQAHFKKCNDEKRKMRDVIPEDLRRQITEAYQQGLRYVQDEMHDFRTRYRVPGDVYYTSRNIMDPVLHFRICHSVRLRHSGGWHDLDNEKSTPEDIRKQFEKEWDDICDPASGYESPQASADDGVGNAPSAAWATQLTNLIQFANRVRTDRGPLELEKSRHETKDNKGWPVICWLDEAKITETQSRFAFFASKPGD